MPGRRNLAREHAQHAHEAPARFQAIHDALIATFPTHDRPLIGHRAILDFLHALHVRRPSGRPLSWRMVRRWRIQEGFPLLPGLTLVSRPVAAPPMTTAFAVTAWLVTRFNALQFQAFRIVSAPEARGLEKGTRPEFRSADSAVPRRSSAA